VVGKRSGGGFELKSGVTVYEVRGGKIDDGRFIPLDR
jgi:hypothetical protein